VTAETTSDLPLARVPAFGRSDRDERAVLRGAQAGSKADLEELFRRYWPPAYRAAYFVVYDRAAAEDIAQEAFLLPCGRSTASTAGLRLGPGFTASW
jgi:hypothetical protein